MRASACSPSLDARESRAFTLSFAFCKLFRQARAKHASKVWKIKEEKKRQEHPTPEALRQLFEKIDTPASPLKSSKDRSKIVEKPSQNRRKIDENSLLGGFGRPRLFRGRVGTRSGPLRDAPKPARERFWDVPGEPRAAGRRPRASPECPKTLPGPSGATSESVRRDKHSQTRHRNDFALILSCRAKAPMCEKCSSCQCFVHFAGC